MHGPVGYSSRKISFFVFVIGITDADTPEVMKSTLGTVIIYARDITKTAKFYSERLQRGGRYFGRAALPGIGILALADL